MALFKKGIEEEHEEPLQIQVDESTQKKVEKKSSFAKVIISIILLVAISIPAGYAGVWFYYAHDVKTSIADAITSLNANIIKEGTGGLTYDSLEVTGFPSNFNIKITGGRMLATLPKTGHTPFQSMEYDFDGSILVESDIFGKVASITLPKALNFSFVNKEGEKKELSFIFNVPMKAELEMDKTPAGLLATYGSPYPWDYTWDYTSSVNHFRRFILKDSGGKIVDGGESMFSYDGFSIEFTNTPNGNNNTIHAVIKADNIAISNDYYELLYKDTRSQSKFTEELVDYILEQNNRSGNVYYNIDATYAGSLEKLAQVPSFDITLKQASFANNLYSFNSDGKLSMSDGETLPNGWLRINLGNFRELINYYLTILNITIKSQSKNASPLAMIPEITSSDVDNFITFLSKVATVYNGGKDLTLVVKKDKGGELLVGSSSIQKISQMFQEIVAAPVIERERERMQQQHQNNMQIQSPTEQVPTGQVPAGQVPTMPMGQHEDAIPFPTK